MHISQLPKASEYHWTSPQGRGKTKTASATYLGKRITFQVPPCRCRLFSDNGSHTLYLSLEQEIHVAFQRIIEAYEAYMPEVLGCDIEYDILPSIRVSEGGYSGRSFTSFRLPVWETQWFNESGGYLRDAPSPSEIGVCSCMLEFQGIWMSSSSPPKTGLKFRCIQVKIEPSSKPTQPTQGSHGAQGGRPVRERQSQGIQYAFLDD